MTSLHFLRLSKTTSYRLILSACLVLVQPWVHAEEIDPPDRVARLSYLQGEAAALLADQADNAAGNERAWFSVTLNRPFTSGDTLWVKDDSRAELQMGSATLRLDQNTDLTLDQLGDDTMALRLSNGAINLLVKRMRNDETISIDTPNGAVLIERPGEYHIDVIDRGTRTRVKIYSGAAKLENNRQNTSLHARQSAEMFAGNRGLLMQDDMDPRDAFDDWSAERNRREMASTSSRYVADDVIGYDELDHHGYWNSEPEYGYVWYPRTVVTGWAPYRHGRWAHIAPWGWTWIDDAPWGFAPFHYGRWAHVHGRWGWVPGPRHVHAVYAPALVAWMGAPGVNVSVSIGPSVGWFPLAPREVFIPGYRCSTRHRHSVNMSNTLIVNHTHIDRAYERGISHVGYANRNIRDAVTVVHRDRFMRAEPTREHIVHVNEGELRRWQPQISAPGVTREAFRNTETHRNPLPRNSDSRGGTSRVVNREPQDNSRRESSRFAPPENRDPITPRVAPPVTQRAPQVTRPQVTEPRTELPTRFAPNRQRQFEFDRQDSPRTEPRIEPRAPDNRFENRSRENRAYENRAPMHAPPPATVQPPPNNNPAPNDTRREAPPSNRSNDRFEGRERGRSDRM